MDEPNQPKSDRYIVPAVDQAIRILMALDESTSPQMSLLEICSEVGIHKSKAFAILHTLNKYNLVIKNDNKKGYTLGSGLLSLSRRLLNNIDARKMAEPILEEVATKGGGTAAFGLIHGEQVFIAAKYEGMKGFGIITNFIGQHFPITHGSAGRAIAAAMPEEALNRLLEKEELYFHGDPSKLDRKRLNEELDHCRNTGYALDYGDINPQIKAAAAAVIGKNKLPIGYLILFGLYSEENLEALGPLVARGARMLSEHINI